MKLLYKKDDDNKEGLFSQDGIHQVMMEWEKDYMEKCIEILNPQGNILEIGFGMGYSADKIQSYDIDSHTIIECNPDVLKKLREYKKSHPNVIIVEGRWQDVLETCSKYDCIFFDDYMLDNNDKDRFKKFLYQILKSHTKINSRIVCYSTTNVNYININCINFSNNEYIIDIPKNCRYACGDRMFIPLITKINESEDDLNNLTHIKKE